MFAARRSVLQVSKAAKAIKPVGTGRRAFNTRSLVKAEHFDDGVYTNLPFKVHNRRFIPYWLVHFGFFGMFFYD